MAEHTFANPSDLDVTTRKFYWGVDPSSDSMTIGNLAALMMVKCFMRHGYKATLLAGGATGQIGDPKETGERDLKTTEEVKANVKGLEEQFRRITGDDFEIVDNNDWFEDMRFMPFLREIFKEFSVTQMLDRKFVQDRIGKGGSGISLAEFCYTTIQGYDFLRLFREKGITLQLCGADQFGNCVSGMQLIRKLEGAEADVWSIPLVIDPVTGRKFGKSEGNAIWLSRFKTGVFDFYQFWLNQSDEAVLNLIKIYTLLMPDEVDQTMAEHDKDKSKRLAQKALAFGSTTVVHGERAALAAQRASELLFGGQAGRGDDLDLLSEILPVYTLGDGETLVNAVAAGLSSSKSEVRRLMEGGGISLNGGKATDISALATPGIVKVGKNKFLVIK